MTMLAQGRWERLVTVNHRSTAPEFRFSWHVVLACLENLSTMARMIG